ncbi:MAG: 3-phosphoshikimate 1-carboxyvinyltransferase [Coriobacteriia bacterium]|nr:3-phosphoshikimate 1-carboxyvinyltransferase [Coriobacteriia bacterium]
MDIEVQPIEELSGTIRVPASKSEAHRALICAALCSGTTMMTIDQLSADIEATIGCLEALGAKIDRKGENVSVTGIVSVPEAPLLNCRESGTTLRLLLPVAAAIAHNATFVGEGRLPKRPIAEILDELSKNGCKASASSLPVALSGGLKAGKFSLPGNITSQFVSGLLIALPKLKGESVIEITTPLESQGYVHMTLDILERFGVWMEDDADRMFTIPGSQAYVPFVGDLVYGDWSSAAFWLVADALGADIKLSGLDPLTYQPDSAIRFIFDRFGTRVVEGDTIFSTHEKLYEAVIDLSQTPDLAPALAVLACAAHGQTSFIGAGRLRIKESDRISAIVGMLGALGGNIQEFDDAFVINGPVRLSGGVVDGKGDHRIVMAAAIAALFAIGPVVIKGADAVEKSYPRFFEDLKSVGGVYREIS